MRDSGPERLPPHSKGHREGNGYQKRHFLISLFVNLKCIPFFWKLLRGLTESRTQDKVCKWHRKRLPLLEQRICYGHRGPEGPRSSHLWVPPTLGICCPSSFSPHYNGQCRHLYLTDGDHTIQRNARNYPKTHSESGVKAGSESRQHTSREGCRVLGGSCSQRSSSTELLEIVPECGRAPRLSLVLNQGHEPPWNNRAPPEGREGWRLTAQKKGGVGERFKQSFLGLVGEAVQVTVLSEFSCLLASGQKPALGLSPRELLST